MMLNRGVLPLLEEIVPLLFAGLKFEELLEFHPSIFWCNVRNQMILMNNPPTVSVQNVILLLILIQVYYSTYINI